MLAGSIQHGAYELPCVCCTWEKGDGEGGVVVPVVVLIHERWRHRVQHVERHSRGRWLKLSIQTPVEVVTIIGYYGRPSPQTTPQAITDWQDPL
jgi:hypothetical protein